MMSSPPQVQEPVREELVEPEAVAALLRLIPTPVDHFREAA